MNLTDKLDRQILETIIKSFGGGPVGIETIASAIGEERVTILRTSTNRSSFSQTSCTVRRRTYGYEARI